MWQWISLPASFSTNFDCAESAKPKLLAEAFPNTMPKAHMLHAINRDNYQQLVVCEKYNFTYEYSDSQECNGEQKQCYNMLICPISKAPSSTHAYSLWYSASEDCKNIFTQNCS